jgi:hypothetical protein
MAFYENQSDMFLKRAENCKRHGDQLYAQAMVAKEQGDAKKYQEYLVQAKNQYKMQEDNEQKAKKHEGKSW